MKKLNGYIVLVVVLLLTINVFSQNCKNLTVNMKDDFTGDVVKEIKTPIIIKGNYQNTTIKVNQNGDIFILTFIYSNSSMRIANSSVLSSKKGDKIYFMLEDSSVIKMDLNVDYVASRFESAGTAERMILGSYAGLSKSNKVIFEPTYSISIEQLEQLKEKRILKTRVIAHGMKSDTGEIAENIEIDIQEREANQFKNDVGCLFINE
ncbi:MAG: hypothetical protein JXB17_08810 [Bacteroidales bacterium]|nr:hypothetical protein [Bacteroidales bacterium]